jgi:hypothetical protein
MEAHVRQVECDLAKFIQKSDGSQIVRSTAADCGYDLTLIWIFFVGSYDPDLMIGELVV